MAEFSFEPTNKSFLSNNKYEFVIKRMPNLTFFIQSAANLRILLKNYVLSLLLLRELKLSAFAFYGISRNRESAVQRLKSGILPPLMTVKTAKNTR